MSHYEDVKQFSLKFGMLVYDEPGHMSKRMADERIQFMKEELQEFEDAVASDDLALQADSLVDLVYVAIGTALALGLPWQELWDDVQRANMEKVRGTTHRGNKVDVTKPEGWVPPKGNEILMAHGYDPDEWEFILRTVGGRDHPEHYDAEVVE